MSDNRVSRENIPGTFHLEQLWSCFLDPEHVLSKDLRALTIAHYLVKKMCCVIIITILLLGSNHLLKPFLSLELEPAAQTPLAPCHLCLLIHSPCSLPACSKSGTLREICPGTGVNLHRDWWWPGTSHQGRFMWPGWVVLLSKVNGCCLWGTIYAPKMQNNLPFFFLLPLLFSLADAGCTAGKADRSFLTLSCLFSESR